MNARQCPDDLLVAARHRRLSDLERHALSAHLARCELCRAGELASDLLREPLFAAALTPDADRALIERVAERASASLTRGVRYAHWGWRRVAVTVVVLLGLGGVASAWIGRTFVSPPAVAPAVDRHPVPTRSDVGPRAHRSEPRLAPPQPSLAPAPPPTPAKKPVAVRPVRGSVVAAAPPETPASLFADAARARHDGDLRRAVTLYGTLRGTFPDSDQARVASVSMGDLLLRLDEPARALRAFDAYLADVQTGPLREEALFGRARCLRKLDEVTAEQETWVRLVRDFPESAYGPIARQRLDQLRQAR